jgi:DNA polymerase V
VVLSNNDGCIVALSPEAKALGFRGGDPYFKKELDLKAHKVAVFSSNYTLYGDISRRVMWAMETVVPKIHQYSIDEAFIPFSDKYSPEQVGWELHDRVTKWVGVPVRVGIGPTRTLAKLANHWAKKISRVLYLELGSPKLNEILENTALEDIWGIGRRKAAKLQKQGITNASQLRDMEPIEARRLLTVTGERTVMELKGIQTITDDLAPTPRKTLISSRSFGAKVQNFDNLMAALAAHAHIAGERLRSEGLLASGLSIFIDTSRFSQKPFNTGATVHFPVPTSSTIDFVKGARMALESAFTPNYDYNRCGIMLHELITCEEASYMLGELFKPQAEAEINKSLGLMEAMDKINQKHGKNTIHVLALGPPRPYWAMRREKLSPFTTTSWGKLPVVTAKP